MRQANENEGRAWWRMCAVLLGGLAVLAIPPLYLARVSEVQAEDPKPAQPAAIAEPEPRPVAPGDTKQDDARQDVTKQDGANQPTAWIQFELAAEFFPEPTPTEKQILTALDQKVSLDVVEQPLVKVLATLEDLLQKQVQIQFDQRALEDAGIGNDIPVTRKVRDVTARSALRLLLDDFDLTYLIRDEVLQITTQDKAESDLFTRTYPVADLLIEVTESPTARGNRPTGGAANAGGMGSGMFQVGGKTQQPAAQQAPQAAASSASPAEQTIAAPVAASKPSAPRYDYDSLIETITTTVKPQTWDEVGGAGSIREVPVASSLVVSQTREVHDEIVELLRSLRAAKRVSVPEVTAGE